MPALYDHGKLWHKKTRLRAGFSVPVGLCIKFLRVADVLRLSHKSVSLGLGVDVIDGVPRRSSLSHWRTTRLSAVSSHARLRRTQELTELTLLGQPLLVRPSFERAQHDLRQCTTTYMTYKKERMDSRVCGNDRVAGFSMPVGSCIQRRLFNVQIIRHPRIDAFLGERRQVVEGLVHDFGFARK